MSTDLTFTQQITCRKCLGRPEFKENLDQKASSGLIGLKGELLYLFSTA